MSKKSFVLYLAITAFLFSCAGLHYNAKSASANARIATKASDLIGKSYTDNYNTDSTDVNALKFTIDSLVQKEKKRSLNHATTAMWTSVQNHKFNLYNYFNLWKTKGTVDSAFAQEYKKQAERILSSITDLENHKLDAPKTTN